ncbi:hypothetical protein CC80DRAFT_547348 [Byssothecium circinans]|uniref:Uncharacterized protein n=1 Tax=Byssothecium circinans TaxID=147558 RepID=A0A6A5TX36_9PLEO|nr:hypothetical protein CC80DRAFT_547348 [Byssothecium circinans]
MVQWNAEKDQLILKGVFQFCDIKCSGPLLKHLAEMIGDDCTPKAVSHRLNNIKNTGKMVKGPNDSTTSTPTKASRGAKGKGKSKAKAGGGNGEDLDGPPPSPTPTPTPKKRGRKVKSEEDVFNEEEQEESLTKKIKSEPIGDDDEDFLNAVM